MYKTIVRAMIEKEVISGNPASIGAILQVFLIMHIIQEQEELIGMNLETENHRGLS